MYRALQRGVRRARHFNQSLKSQGVSPLARAILVLQKIKQRLLPMGTWRWRCYRLTLGRFSGPLLRWSYRSWQSSAAEVHPDLQALEDLAFQDIPLLQFSEQGEPLVSILIPVYEQWRVTYGCLRSILKYSGNSISYEVLIFDDHSKDEIQHLHEKTPGVRYIRNKDNLRFLRNCNHGAQFARGKYFLFLNNDTLVHEGWLEAMVNRIAGDSTIGLVGAKLIGRDGSLQEAGGIIFQDGSGWNYGRGADPNHPAFNFFKDTDYVSGACMLLPRFLWTQLGGFDEQFAPAYYEDTDLAFSVRAAGYRTVYEPRAVITHLEGISHGTDVNAGMKRYQMENQIKFRKKWEKTLQAEHASGPEDLDRAQCRGVHRPCVFVADYQIPQWENEAGLRLTWMYLQLFVDLGYRVLFRPSNLFPVQPNTSVMEAKGIEVLQGADYLDMDSWLKEHGRSIDYAYLNRWEVAEPLLAPLRRHTKARIVFQCIDLHFLREQRAWENAGHVGVSPESARQKKIEFHIIEAVDAVHTPSIFERNYLRKEFPDKHIQDVPIYFYQDLQEYTLSAKGSNLLFVGGYGHPPNEDAVQWFHAKILPEVLKSYPETRVHLVGGGAGKEIQALSSSVTKLYGRIDDAALDEIYGLADIAVVPLRFGAGVKGKVIEAMAKGLPVVTTSIGAEGIAKSGCPLVIADTPEEIAARIVALLKDSSARRNLAEQGQSFVRKHFARTRAEAIIREDFPHSSTGKKLERDSC